MGPQTCQPRSQEGPVWVSVVLSFCSGAFTAALLSSPRLKSSLLYAESVTPPTGGSSASNSPSSCLRANVIGLVPPGALQLSFCHKNPGKESQVWRGMAMLCC